MLRVVEMKTKPLISFAVAVTIAVTLLGLGLWAFTYPLKPRARAQRIHAINSLGPIVLVSPQTGAPAVTGRAVPGTEEANSLKK
jgi:hypothetical protein